MNIREEIIKIGILYSSETNEEKLLNAVEKAIEELRREWKINSKNFSKEDIIDLKRMASKLTAIKRLVYIISHPEDIFEKSYPLKATSNLRKLEEEVRGVAIEEKINKQIRIIFELKSKLPSKKIIELISKLPSKKVVRQSTTYRDVLLRLKLEAPICPKCKVIMILKEGKHSSFYGCENFPKCMQRVWISRRQNELINRLDPRNQY